MRCVIGGLAGGRHRVRPGRARTRCLRQRRCLPLAGALTILPLLSLPPAGVAGRQLPALTATMTPFRRHTNP